MFFLALAGLAITYAGAFWAGFLYGVSRERALPGTQRPSYDDTVAESKRLLAKGR